MNFDTVKANLSTQIVAKTITPLQSPRSLRLAINAQC
jgi:hypothetical protein